MPARYRYIIQNFEIKQIITDTLWVYATVSHFSFECQTAGPKNAALKYKKSKSIGSDSPL
jgi:hypothetical protein